MDATVLALIAFCDKMATGVKSDDADLLNLGKALKVTLGEVAASKVTYCTLKRLAIASDSIDEAVFDGLNTAICEHVLLESQAGHGTRQQILLGE